jgi:large repetitive protein
VRNDMKRRHPLRGATSVRHSMAVVVSVFAVLSIWSAPSWAGSSGGSSGSGGSSATIHVNVPRKPSVSSVHPNAGPPSGGQAITITGTGFVTGASVVIGQGQGPNSPSIAASHVVVVSATEITAVTAGPAKAGTWNLFVTTPGGTSSANNGDDYTYEHS